MTGPTLHQSLEDRTVAAYVNAIGNPGDAWTTGYAAGLLSALLAFRHPYEVRDRTDNTFHDALHQEMMEKARHRINNPPKKMVVAKKPMRRPKKVAK